MVEVPRTIKQFYSNVELSVDVMHMNDVPFLTSISEYIHYGTGRAIDNMICITLEAELKNIVQSYAVRGFRVTVIIVDTQFKALKDRNVVRGVFNVVFRGEYVSKVERFHEVIKERCRCYFVMLPFDNLPRMMVVYLMKTVMFCINAFA